MAAELRIKIVLLLCLLAAADGCAMRKPAPLEPVALTREQAEWWEANKDRKKYVPGRGYYVEGTSGFFDENGRKLPTNMLSGSHDEDADSEGFLDKVAPKKAYKKFLVMIGKGPDEQLAKKELAEGDSLFRQKLYAKAAKHYKKAYARWPDSPLEEEAIFKTAESEFFADRYSKADDAYALLTKKFSSTQYLSQVVVRRFEIGRYWERYDSEHPHWPITANLVDKTRPMFDTGGHALRVYERIRLDDPTGPLADDSIMASASHYFVKGRWGDADYQYGLLRTEYPKSEFQYQAHLLGLRCKLLKYQGPGYDGKPLDEAEEIATQLLTQFNPELGEERERIVTARAGINAQRALREWELAEYYAKGKYYGASRHFYDKIVSEYPETQLAEESRSRLEKFRAEPDSPTPPFDWLVNLFPESKREGPVLPKVTPVVASGNSSTVRK